MLSRLVENSWAYQIHYRELDTSKHNLDLSDPLVWFAKTLSMRMLKMIVKNDKK